MNSALCDRIGTNLSNCLTEVAVETPFTPVDICVEAFPGRDGSRGADVADVDDLVLVFDESGRNLSSHTLVDMATLLFPFGDDAEQ